MDLETFSTENIPWNNEWRTFDSPFWRSNSQLEFFLNEPASRVLVDAVSGNQNIINYDQLQTQLDKWGGHIEYTRLDGTLTRAMLGAFDPNLGTPGGEYYTGLLDLESEKLLWKRFDDGLLSFPRYRVLDWSHDNQQVAFVYVQGSNNLQIDLYVMNRDGEDGRAVTNFRRDWNGYEVIEPTWSFDNQYVAFWLYLIDPVSFDTPLGREDSNPTLYVYDTFSDQVVRLCSAPDYFEYSAILWSPHNRQIAYQIEYQTPTGEIEYAAVIFDLETGSEMVIPDVQRFAWADLP